MRRRLLVGILLFFPFFTQAQTVIRVNQLGYLPVSLKVAVLLSKDPQPIPAKFDLCDAITDAVVWESRTPQPFGEYAGFPQTFRLDFSPVNRTGGYYLKCGATRSPDFRIADDVYDGTADFLLNYMRQQRCGYNPFLRDSCHTHDGYIIYHPTLDSTFIDVVGGWHDASDYLQYVTTSATAAFQMLFAYQQHPGAFGDRYDNRGLPGANGIPDILDEAKWGLDWLVKMNPRKDLMFNQIADDRDHMGFKLPSQDSISYGRGLERPVYFCNGKPQGVFKYKNRTTGLASTAGKFSSSFALGAAILAKYYPTFAAELTVKAKEAFESGEASPGVCQTAPCRAPYFYEEDNWTDDMELAGTQLHALTGDNQYLQKAAAWGRSEPYTPWMGTDSARHYQWYPFVNIGHYLLAANNDKAIALEFIRNLRTGIQRVADRGKKNPFLFGTPFIWCSNNYMSAMLTDLRLYAQVTRDSTYLPMEASLRDWLFGCNPWGTSMIVGLPEGGVSPRDPHSAFSHLYHYKISGGLVDGPVKGTFFKNLLGISLSKEDAFKDFQSDVAVYHDDWGDYSTDEPTMDGSAGLTYYFSTLESEGGYSPRLKNCERTLGGITRMDSTKKVIYLAFTAHEFAEGGTLVRETLKKQKVKASFFFTGDFYRNPAFAGFIKQLKSEGHYLGGHSDKHLLYASWEKRDSLLVTKEDFQADLQANYRAMERCGTARAAAPYFMPPFEWYNQSVSDWSRAAGLTLVNFTPGTSSSADYTTPDMGGRYLSSDSIYARILGFESHARLGLNGFILLTHIGTDPARTDKFYRKLEGLITELKRRGYKFEPLGAGH